MRRTDLKNFLPLAPNLERENEDIEQSNNNQKECQYIKCGGSLTRATDFAPEQLRLSVRALNDFVHGDAGESEHAILPRVVCGVANDRPVMPFEVFGEDIRIEKNFPIR